VQLEAVVRRAFQQRRGSGTGLTRVFAPLAAWVARGAREPEAQAACRPATPKRPGQLIARTGWPEFGLVAPGARPVLALFQFEIRSPLAPRWRFPILAGSSGLCWRRDKSQCKMSTAGKASPKSLPIKSLTSPPNAVISSRQRSRQTQFRHKSRRKHSVLHYPPHLRMDSRFT
jgi:hypothetical protein